MIYQDINVNLSKLTMSILPRKDMDEIGMIYLGIAETLNSIDRNDLYFCLTSSWINDSIINIFLSSLITVSYNKLYFSTRFFANVFPNRASNKVIYRFN